MKKDDANESIERLARAIRDNDCILIGAGAGMSAAAGMAYSGERFERYFSGFASKYGFDNMYFGGFAPFETPEERWAFWSRYIWINRYAPIPKDTYSKLYDLVRDKDYFVLTTNVDHCFQRAGFVKERLFYTQGDFGLFQCSVPCTQGTWDNYDEIRAMVEAQGYVIEEDGTLRLPEGVVPKMEVPSELLPVCPHCGEPATTNLRADAFFAEDEGWHAASDRYAEYVHEHVGPGKPVLLLEFGVGANTPVIIKYPFWRMTAFDDDAIYACVNLGETYAPKEIRERSILIDEDIDQVLRELEPTEQGEWRR